MEILDDISTLQEHKECVTTTTGKASHVLCPLNLNKLFIGALFNTKHCKACEYFCGIVKYPNIPPRLICKATDVIKLLEFYTNCTDKNHESVKSSECSRCFYFNSIDVTNGYIKCGKVIKKTEKTVQLFPTKQLNIEFPFSFNCAKTGIPCTIDQCIKQQSDGTIIGCQFFKGFHKSRNASKVKICCTHSKAVGSEYVTCRFSKPKKPKEETLHTPCLRWLYEDSIKTKKLGLKVDCLGIERRHYSQRLNVNCLSNGIDVAECRLCPEYLSVKGFRIQCKLYPTAIFVHCPHGKGATHKKGSQVNLQTCVKCPQFLKIEDDKVHCRYTRVQGLVSKPPKRGKMSRLTHREKETLYIDVPD